jgi:DNA-binding XRE family transcriptional regulator
VLHLFSTDISIKDILLCQSIFDRIDGVQRIGSIVSMVTAAQCRAARGLLEWTQQDLADAAGIGIVTVRQLEAGLNEPRRSTLQVVRRALEAAGVEFIDENGGGAGVRLRKPHQPPRKKSNSVT